MSDLISRADALKPFCIAPDGTRIPEVDCDNFPVEFSVEFIKKHLLSLPSAEAPKPTGDSISRSDARDKAKEIMYSILDDTDYDDIESMAHACLMMKIKILKMFDEFPSADMVSREDFEPVDNKLYLNPVCRNCKHSSYCNNIPVDENNEDIEHYDVYGGQILSVKECKNYEPESE